MITVPRLAFPLTALALCSFHGVPSVGGEASWTHWRGPMQNGLSSETDWTPEGRAENLWSAEVGLGYSSVTVADGRLFTMGYDEAEGLDLIWCLDAETGEELWAYPYPAKIWNEAHRGGTLGTPTIDGDEVFALNREGNLHCFDAETGDIIWHRQIHEELGLKYPRWGYSGAPLVLGDDLIINGGKTLCLDKKSGRMRWASKDYGDAYCTPVAFELKGKSVLAFLNGDGLAVIDREQGAELYFYDWSGSQGINAATPIVIDDTIFISSSRRGGGTLLSFGEKELEVVWEGREMVSQLSGCVLMDEHLYGFDMALLKCIDKSGETKWSARGIGNGAIAGSPGRLIAMSSRGELIVAEATPDAYRELSRAKLFDGGVNWTTPVLVGGLIYCRNNEGQLVCRDHRG